MLKRLYAELVLWLIRPGIEKALEPDGLIWSEFERGGPGGAQLSVVRVGEVVATATAATTEDFRQGGPLSGQ